MPPYILPRSDRVIWNGSMYITRKMPFDLNWNCIIVDAPTAGPDFPRITVHIISGEETRVFDCRKIPLPLALLRFQRRFRRMRLVVVIKE